MTQSGLVVAHQGVKIVVRNDNGEARAYPIKRRSDFVVGDHVYVDNSHPQLIARRNLLQRQTPYGLQSIAANLDGVGIVIAQMPPVPRLFIDQVVVAARAQDIKPFIVITKRDLYPSEELVISITKDYGGEVPIIEANSKMAKGTDALRACVKRLGRCMLVGISGAGKSSLLNAIIGASLQKTSETVDKDRHGQHTTSQAVLYTLPTGGELIDSPGVRDFAPPPLSPNEVAHYFAGFGALLLEPCHFNNCLHVSEPGCVIKKAVQSGTLSAHRYENYIELLGPRK